MASGFFISGPEMFTVATPLATDRTLGLSCANRSRKPELGCAIFSPRLSDSWANAENAASVISQEWERSAIMPPLACQSVGLNAWEEALRESGQQRRRTPWTG